MTEIDALYDPAQLVHEIADYCGEPAPNVRQRFDTEMGNPTSTVRSECAHFGVTPHVFDARMIHFYADSDAFIYETLVESMSPYRFGKWSKILEFIQNERKSSKESTWVLVYGDSVGNDSLHLSLLGYNVVYHELDSYCSRFAHRRFASRGLSIADLSETREKSFDFVICLEVLEHVPEPAQLVMELSKLTARDGFCIVSDGFSLLDDRFPTHLASNSRYIGKTVDLFGSVGMRLFWRDSDDKPYVFTHHAGPRYTVRSWAYSGPWWHVRRRLNRWLRRAG
jgi:SAM-dependent methyltransferase